MATGSPFLPRRQRPSHWLSWGQTRPVTQGRALSSSSDSAAPWRSPSATRSMKRGMLTRTGQPSMHRGFLHWRQRSASAAASTWLKPRLTSVKCVRPDGRVLGGHRGALDGHPLPGVVAGPGAHRPGTGRCLVRVVREAGDEACGAPLDRRLLEVAIRRQPVCEHPEVDLVGVELGAVDAGVAGLAVDAHPAATAHAGAIDHDRVERHDRGHLVRRG